jgi:hypothetical protein
MLRGRLADSAALPASFCNASGAALDRAVALAERVAGQGQDMLARQAATATYDVNGVFTRRAGFPPRIGAAPSRAGAVKRFI